MSRYFIVLLVVFLMCTPFSGANAGMDEIEVIADVTGDSPVDAQQKAVSYAKKRAFFLSLSKHTPEKAQAIATSLTDAQIENHIRGYQLVQDRMEGNRYIARYKVSVSEDMVSHLLVNDAPAADSAVNPILVIPVLNNNSELLLWEQDNVWRSIWNGVALERGENLLIMPFGDPTDSAKINSASVLSYRYEDLAELAQRYGAHEIVIALADLKNDRNPQGVEVTLRRLGPGMDKRKVTFYETSGKGESAESAMPDAARTIADELKELARYYEGEKERRIADASKLQLKAQFRRLSDWVSLQGKLAKLPQVVRLDIGAIDIQTAAATLYYNGTPDSMRQIMEANGLRVNPEGGIWTVSVN